MKTYEATRGLLLDDSFGSHCAKCERCALFDATKPASAAALCLEGSVLWKRENIARSSTPKAIDPHRVSKETLRGLMKYKN